MSSSFYIGLEYIDSKTYERCLPSLDSFNFIDSAIDYFIPKHAKSISQTLSAIILKVNQLVSWFFGHTDNWPSENSLYKNLLSNEFSTNIKNIQQTRKICQIFNRLHRPQEDESSFALLLLNQRPSTEVFKEICLHFNGQALFNLFDTLIQRDCSEYYIPILTAPFFLKLSPQAQVIIAEKITLKLLAQKQTQLIDENWDHIESPFAKQQIYTVLDQDNLATNLHEVPYIDQLADLIAKERTYKRSQSSTPDEKTPLTQIFILAQATTPLQLEKVIRHQFTTNTLKNNFKGLFDLDSILMSWQTWLDDHARIFPNLSKLTATRESIDLMRKELSDARYNMIGQMIINGSANLVNKHFDLIPEPLHRFKTDFLNWLSHQASIPLSFRAEFNPDYYQLFKYFRSDIIQIMLDRDFAKLSEELYFITPSSSESSLSLMSSFCKNNKVDIYLDHFEAFFSETFSLDNFNECFEILLWQAPHYLTRFMDKVSIKSKFNGIRIPELSDNLMLETVKRVDSKNRNFLHHYFDRPSEKFSDGEFDYFAEFFKMLPTDVKYALFITPDNCNVTPLHLSCRGTIESSHISLLETLYTDNNSRFFTSLIKTNHLLFKDLYGRTPIEYVKEEAQSRLFQLFIDHTPSVKVPLLLALCRRCIDLRKHLSVVDLVQLSKDHYDIKDLDANMTQLMNKNLKDIKIENELMIQFEKINFTNPHQSGYRDPQSLYNDDRLISPEQLKLSLKKLINNINTEDTKLLGLSPNPKEITTFYSRLSQLLKLIIVELKKLEPSTAKTQDEKDEKIRQCTSIIIDLAISAEHCAGRQMAEVFLQFQLLRGQVESLKFRQQISMLLADLRQNIFRDQAFSFSEKHPTTGIRNTQKSAHIFNGLLKHFGLSYGILGSDLIIDNLSSSYIKDEMITSSMKVFAEQYTPNTIINNILEKTANNQAFREQLYDWLKEDAQVKKWHKKHYDLLSSTIVNHPAWKTFLLQTIHSPVTQSATSIFFNDIEKLQSSFDCLSLKNAGAFTLEQLNNGPLWNLSDGDLRRAFSSLSKEKQHDIQIQAKQLNKNTRKFIVALFETFASSFSRRPFLKAHIEKNLQLNNDFQSYMIELIKEPILDRSSTLAIIKKSIASLAQANFKSFHPHLQETILTQYLKSFTNEGGVYQTQLIIEEEAKNNPVFRDLLISMISKASYTNITMVNEFEEKLKGVVDQTKQNFINLCQDLFLKSERSKSILFTGEILAFEEKLNTLLHLNPHLFSQERHKLHSQLIDYTSNPLLFKYMLCRISNNSSELEVLKTQVSDYFQKIATARKLNQYLLENFDLSVNMDILLNKLALPQDQIFDAIQEIIPAAVSRKQGEDYMETIFDVKKNQITPYPIAFMLVEMGLFTDPLTD